MLERLFPMPVHSFNEKWFVNLAISFEYFIVTGSDDSFTTDLQFNFVSAKILSAIDSILFKSGFSPSVWTITLHCLKEVGSRSFDSTDKINSFSLMNIT